MPGSLSKVPRQFMGRGSDDVMAIPDLVDIQLSSYERLLQRGRLRDGHAPDRQGLEEAFQDIFPIESPNGDMVLEYAGYSLDEGNIKFTEKECRKKGRNYEIPIKAKINLVFLQTGEIRQKEIYMGDIPLMTDRGTFIINGAERVVVSQIHRSPGAIFSHEKGVYASRIIPYRGSWLEFEIDQKKELIYAKIDRKKRLLATVFLRALGFDSREKIIDLFYRRTTVAVSADSDAKSQLVNKILARPVHRDGARLYRAGEKLLAHDVEELVNIGAASHREPDAKRKEQLDGIRQELDQLELQATDYYEILQVEPTAPAAEIGKAKASRLDEIESEMRELRKGDHYETLGVGRNATPEEIDAAYRAKIQDVHPDLEQDSDKRKAKTEETKAVNDAKDVLKDVLSDESKRKAYNKSLDAGRERLKELDALRKKIADAYGMLSNILEQQAALSARRKEIDAEYEALTGAVDTFEVEIIDQDHPDSLHSAIVVNCFEREDTRPVPDEEDDELTREDAVLRVHAAIKPGEPVTIDSAERDLHSMFFSSRRYDLGRVGRYKLNKKFDYPEPPETHTLVPDDIVNTMIMLTKVYIGEGNVDDIDHLGNRRIRSVGELLTNHLKIAFSRMERIAKERMSLKEADTIRPQDLVSIKPILATIKEFFGSSQLSQFMDQVNPLAELAHKRRLNALGPGGLSRDRAGFEVRDVHYTHYGRMCPIETPEGPNIGLIVSLANYTRVNDYGFLETPYRKVVDGRVTRETEYLSAIDEEKFFIAQAGAPVDDDGQFTETLVPVRHGEEYVTSEPDSIRYMDVSPKQIISVSASLIPFLEHDDANRALMGSNMQRQAVPLITAEPPRVGTGMEEKTAYDSGVLVTAKRAGVVEYVSSECVKVRPDRPGDDARGPDDGSPNVDAPDVYPLRKYERTNQDTCFLQKPVRAVGDRVEARQVLADGPSTYAGELALGRNVIVAFMPWNGYNYEDAILVSSRMVKDDVFTSIHIKEFKVEVRETKLGPEKITRDIPNTAEDAFDHLDEEGIARIGAKVKPGSILVGKVTPKSETDSTPEFKLLNSIFGEKAKEVRDTSKRVPAHGVEGTVIDVLRMRRSDGDDLSPGVEEEVRVYVASKRKLQEGDKMAGRHGNKGVVACVLPEEDMPFMADGTPVDVVLNPLGVPSRMNLGQIMETELGWAGLRLDEWYATPVFQSASNEMIEAKLAEAGLPTTSKITLYDGLTGEPFENPVTCGVTYLMKLSHLVDDKMHSRATGPYSLVTQQPLGGKAQNGGQRLGEMEVWALEAYGAANTLRELLTVKSDDMHGRAKVYESIVKGEPFEDVGIPESFNVLVQELRGLALDITIFDGKGQEVPLTERDDELITRAGARF